MAAGIPVVADAVGQNAITITHGVSGLLTPPGDVVAMAEAVVSLLHDDRLCLRLALGARRRIAEGLTWDRLAERMEEVYLQHTA